MSKQITIQGVPVEVSTPYEPGHQITEAEAKALNQVRAENVGNNMRARIKEIVGDATEVSKKMISEAQKLISAYDAAYEFTLASVGGGRSRMSPVEKEAMSIARAAFAGALREKGLTKKEWIEANGGEEAGKDAYNNKIAEIANMDQVQAKARENVEARQSLGNIDVGV